ncbi:hypothetical protein, partial [uncultured Ruthenibacterium sp.]|uniref:hypothetical protein n=1 Tax=uncultured Ruthenibacterium sp. TaxID=1905347 RepID=UPI002593278D
NRLGRAERTVPVAAYIVCSSAFFSLSQFVFNAAGKTCTVIPIKTAAGAKCSGRCFCNIKQYFPSSNGLFPALL